MTKTLQDFINDYDRWLQRVEENNLFGTHCGSCVSLTHWCEHYNIRRDMYPELKKLFVEEGLDPNYPFNQHGRGYWNEVYHYLVRDNTERIAWYRRHAK